VQYIISRGISPERITAKGYGESQLVIPNAKTEEEHQVNRRTEFKVIGISESE
jgi:peptidoglycan-associated lipoprotein